MKNNNIKSQHLGCHLKKKNKEKKRKFFALHQETMIRPLRVGNLLMSPRESLVSSQRLCKDINITRLFSLPSPPFLKKIALEFCQLPSVPVLKRVFLMCVGYRVINIKMIHPILVRLQTTGAYVGHCSVKDGQRGAQLPPG